MFSSSSERHLKGPSLLSLPPAFPLSTLLPFSGFSPGCGATGRGSAFTSRLSHRDTQTVLEKQGKKEKGCNRRRSCECVFEVQRVFKSILLWQGLPEFMRWVPQPKTTHTLKMEVKDQSCDGQVGEKWKISDGREIETRKGSLLWFFWTMLDSERLLRCLVKLSEMIYGTGADTFMSSVTALRHNSGSYLRLCCAAYACVRTNHSLYLFYLHISEPGTFIGQLSCPCAEHDQKRRHWQTHMPADKTSKGPPPRL